MTDKTAIVKSFELEFHRVRYVATLGNAEYNIPEYMREGIIRYVIHGVIPGDFLQGIISGDLYKACWHADNVNKPRIPAYAKWFFNVSPRDCYGSVDKMLFWKTIGGLQGWLDAEQRKLSDLERAGNPG